MNEPIITTHNLTRRFGDVTAVDQLTLEIPAGEIFGLLGHNGAGKTTTIRLLNGVLTPSGGEATVLGCTPAVEGPKLRRRTGVLTETPSLDERLTGRENLAIYAELFDVPREKTAGRVAELLELFALAERGDDKVGGYSKGMKQRLALARALLHEPDILFLDEPTAGLDPIATRQVHDLIRRLSQEEGRTVLLCTHNLVEAQQLCQRVAVLENGRLLALGTPGELARQLHRAQRLEIDVAPADVERAAAVLAELPRLEVATDLAQPTLQVSGAAREQIPDLLAALVAAQVGVYRLQPQEPSLEDIYFALHGQKQEKNT